MNRLIIFAILVVCALMLHLHHEQSATPDSTQPRVRRSIFALNATQRKGFFWSVKALTVLPPPKTYGYWTYSSILAGADNATIKKHYTTKPKCIHDLLMASHQSAAEHRNFYFISYHRHWLILYEIWLNFAHDVLRGGKEKLLKHYPADVYENYSSLWDAVFDEYKKEKMDQIPEMAAHYYNPINYKMKEDILFPKELSNPKDN
jgi:hypothetical protein